MWYCSKATCTHWLIDIIGCHVASPPHWHEGTYYENTRTRSKCGFLRRVTGLIRGWLIATQDSFNKNTSRFTLIIHPPTATGAIKQCSSVNESTIWSTYLFVNSKSKCSALVCAAQDAHRDSAHKLWRYSPTRSVISRYLRLRKPLLSKSDHWTVTSLDVKAHSGTIVQRFWVKRPSWPITNCSTKLLLQKKKQ